MKQLNCVLFNIFFSLTVSLSTGQNTTRHENVQPATVKVPWLVSMQVHAWHYCGGSIIAHQWILTSAFCTSGKIAESLAVRVGSSSHRSGGKIIKVKRFIQHENYISHIHEFDFALLELEEPLNFTKSIQSITLSNADEQIQDGTPCMFSGWGNTRRASQYKDTFHATILPITNQENCNKAYEFIHAITPQMICAGGGRFRKNTCHGDEGSPLACKDPENGEIKLIGIVSWAEGCANPKYPGVYARVQSIRSWIQEKTGN